MISDKKLNQSIETFLKRNPKIREAMHVFDISSKEYKKALRALSKRQVIVSSNTTNPLWQHGKR